MRKAKSISKGLTENGKREGEKMMFGDPILTRNPPPLASVAKTERNGKSSSRVLIRILQFIGECRNFEMGRKSVTFHSCNGHEETNAKKEKEFVDKIRK